MSKINLLYGFGDYMSGHINIDPLGDPENSKIHIGDWKNLDEWVDDAEATEIIALYGIVEFIPRTEINTIVDHWVKKLRHGGTLIIGFTDIYEVAREFVNFNLSTTEVNKAFHGEQGRPEHVKRCSFTTAGMSEYLAILHDMNIIKKRLNGFDAVVEAQRK